MFYRLERFRSRLGAFAASLWYSRRSVALGALVSLSAFLIVVVLLIEHKPSWYQPATLDAFQLERARLDATTTWNDISGRMVRGRSFEVTLSEQAVNEWLAVLAHDRPELFASWPADVQSPAIGFVAGQIRISAFYESGGWRVIVTVGMRPRISAGGRYCALELDGAYLGSLPVNRSLVARFVQPILRDSPESNGERHRATPWVGADVRTADWLCRGLRIENRFVWPNGDRPFRIESIAVADGTLRVRLNPL